MIRRPPRSTLFPYRRSSDLAGGAGGRTLHPGHLEGLPAPVLAGRRSEEHTSELQSRLHLVCRLLLEKKKKARQVHATPHTTTSRADSDANNMPHMSVNECRG